MAAFGTPPPFDVVEQLGDLVDGRVGWRVIERPARAEGRLPVGAHVDHLATAVVGCRVLFSYSIRSGSSVSCRIVYILGLRQGRGERCFSGYTA